MTNGNSDPTTRGTGTIAVRCLREGIAKMRIAAGILMILGAVLGITLLRATFGFIPGLLGLLPWPWAISVFLGGFYTLKRTNWKICLFSSILLLPYIILPFLAWSEASGEEINVPFALVITLIFLMIGTFPVISVCLRKREWESS